MTETIRDGSKHRTAETIGAPKMVPMISQKDHCSVKMRREKIQPIKQMTKEPPKQVENLLEKLVGVFLRNRLITIQDRQTRRMIPTKLMRLA